MRAPKTPVCTGTPSTRSAPQSGHLPRQPLGLLGSVAARDAEEHAEAGADLANHFPAHAHARLGHSLHDCLHVRAEK
jgi:hypothetical protein